MHKQSIKTGAMRLTTLARLTAVVAIVSSTVVLWPVTGSAQSPSLDELLDIKPAPAKPSDAKPSDAKPGDTKPADVKPGDEVTDLKLKLITPPEAGSSPAQVFNRALDRMREASDRMGEKRDVGLQTQRLQASALELMDQVIAEAAKQQRQKKQDPQDKPEQKQSGSSQNASQPKSQQQSGPPDKQQESKQAGEENTSSGSPMDAKAGDPLEQMKDQWGNLPPRLRQQLLQGMNERFSPIYQQLTEAYYKRLAQEASE